VAYLSSSLVGGSPSPTRATARSVRLTRVNLGRRGFRESYNRGVWKTTDLSSESGSQVAVSAKPEGTSYSWFAVALPPAARLEMLSGWPH
jgi:hypothetical protein